MVKVMLTAVAIEVHLSFPIAHHLLAHGLRWRATVQHELLRFAVVHPRPVWDQRVSTAQPVNPTRPWLRDNQKLNVAVDIPSINVLLQATTALLLSCGVRASVDLKPEPLAGVNVASGTASLQVRSVDVKIEIHSLAYIST
jgi:hypothetical protein